MERPTSTKDKEELPAGEPPVKEFVQPNNPKGCMHTFIRNGSHVTCTKCHVGYYDPNREFPIKDFNLYYSNENNLNF